MKLKPEIEKKLERVVAFAEKEGFKFEHTIEIDKQPLSITGHRMPWMLLEFRVRGEIILQEDDFELRDRL